MPFVGSSSGRRKRVARIARWTVKLAAENLVRCTIKILSSSSKVNVRQSPRIRFQCAPFAMQIPNSQSRPGVWIIFGTSPSVKQSNQ